MKMLENIKGYKKEYVFENYSRIVESFKDYDKITKVKMVEEIYKVYSDYHNIIDICTTRELKFLKMYFDHDENYKKDKYNWERKTLAKKFLIDYMFSGEIEIPEEIYESAKMAVEQVNWNETKKKDEINEILVAYCKIQGSCLVNTLVQFGSALLEKKEEDITIHIESNRLFHYYVFLFLKDYEFIGTDIATAAFQDYYYILEDLDEQRRKQGVAFSGTVNLEDYISLFYNDFNMNNPLIKKFYNELNSLPIFTSQVIEIVQEYALLNLKRDALKESIASIPILYNHNLTKFFQLMEQAMDEMPSGALNGATPNELKNIKLEKKKYEDEKNKKYSPQQNACLSQKEAKLFYKLYFGILDFTNTKFKIKPNFKIYNQTSINPNEIIDIVEKFWEAEDEIIMEFSISNPFKFSKEELKLIQEFKKGFRDTVIIVEYQKEYTAVMNTNKVFMIKGINCNIDQVIPYKNLPYMTITSILPFKDKLIYDSLFQSYNINFGNGFTKAVEEQYNNSMKYYHL